YNKQACEQLNAWMGGYESMLKKMTPGNFNWFLHSMLYMSLLNKRKRQVG
ncbi:hypothetical protein L208DRAFT_1351871, partial [Tricholoma matsutake]